MRIMNLPQIQRESMIQLTCTIATTIIGFFSTMIFTHVLGKDLMGVYFLFLTYVSIFNLIGDSGFGASAVKRISEGKEQNELFTAFVSLRTILLIVSTLILISVPYFINDISETLIFIVIALIFAYISSIITVGLSAKNHMGVVSLSNGLGELTRIVISIILVLLGCSLLGLIWGYLIGTIMIAFYCLKLKKLNYKLVKFNKNHVKSLFLFGIWMFLINTVATVMGYADTIFINYFMETGDVGVYRVVLNFSACALFVANAIIFTLPPKISKWSVDNQKEIISKTISHSITWSLVIAVPMFIGALLLSEKMLYFFYGSDFAIGYTTCIILFLQQVVNIFLLFLACALANSGHAKQGFYGAFAALILNIILNIILIPKLGIEGAAIASLIAVALNTVITYFYLNKTIPVKFEWKSIISIIVSSALMGVIVWLIHPQSLIALLLSIITGVIVYAVVLLLINKPLKIEIISIIKKLFVNNIPR